MMQKGQASIENLILIGGAVLIAVVILTILISLGGQSRESSVDQVNSASSSTDVAIAPTIINVKANYLDCVSEEIYGTTYKKGHIYFSWKSVTKEGTYRLIIKNNDGDILNNGKYHVVYNGEIQDSENLNPNFTNNLFLGDIDLGSSSCGDTYYLTIEVSKNNQYKESPKYAFSWSDNGEKTDFDVVFNINPESEPTEINLPAPSFTSSPGYYPSLFELKTKLYVPFFPDTNIYYTLDGSNPTTESLFYTGEDIFITYNNFTIKAIAERNNVFSKVSEATYTYNKEYYTLKELYNLGYADINNQYISPTGEINLPEVDDFIFKTKFKLNQIENIKTLMTYKYSGNANRASNQRSGFKFYVSQSGYFYLVSTQNGAGNWWLYTGSFPNENGNYQYDFTVNKYYDVFFAKRDRYITTCALNYGFTTYHCNPWWYYPNYNIDSIFYGTNPSLTYDSIIGASNHEEQGVFYDFFKGVFDTLEIYKYSEDNFIAAQNNLPLDNYIFKIDLTK